MRDALQKLLSLGSVALLSESPDLSEECVGMAGPLAVELRQMLAHRNGFYAFESALHVLPAGEHGSGMNLGRWNSTGLWRAAYGDLAEGCFFFAEDIFGGQFCTYQGSICTFDPETGDKERIASDFEGWARSVLDDYPMLTGYPLAREWQAIHGPIENGKRLLPKRPFVLEGEYSLGNLYLADAVEGMRFRGELAIQIRDLPDGASIRFEVTD